MSRTTTLAAALCSACLASPVRAQSSRWGAADEPTVKFMVDMEAKWASTSCSPQPDVAAAIADDFQGTSTSGARYGRADAITADPKSPSRDCKLGDVKVRFFGDAIAVAYGEESRVLKSKDGESKRCQVWTDTWLKRDGKWQIVAAQDTIVPCRP